MRILIAGNCLCYINYYFILQTSDDTRQQQNNSLQMSLRGVLIGKETKENYRITDRETFTVFYHMIKYHKCIQSFTHHYFLILSSVWAWLDTFLLCVASSHNHLMLSDSLSLCLCVSLMHMAMCVQRGLESRRTTTDGKTKWEREDELTHLGHLCQDKTNPESENHLIRVIADK